METPYYYTDFNSFLSKHFSGKVQKISINAGFTCPNRDGRVGTGGCTYCNNQTFNPSYCKTEKTITEQLQEGKNFFTKKYPKMEYLAYFQAYTNTYASLDELKRKYEEALSVDGVVGLVVGTRPDCMPSKLLDYLEELNKRTFVLVEYGIESANDRILKRINRGHDFATVREAVEKTSARGIAVGGHIILGLPGESREELLDEAPLLSSLPLDTLKLHQLQLIRGTRMAKEYEESPEDFALLFDDYRDYIELVIDYIMRVNKNIALERFTSQSPRELLIAPDWGLKNYEFVDQLRKRMKEKGVCQGQLL